MTKMDSLINCANCHNQSTEPESVSLLQSTNGNQVSQCSSVTEIIAEVFGVDDKLEFLLTKIEDESDVPYLCERCYRVIRECCALRNEFLTLCHPSATLRTILVDDTDDLRLSGALIETTVAGGQEADSFYSKKNLGLKKCKIVIKPLPFVYESPTLSNMKIKEDVDLSSLCSWNDDSYIVKDEPVTKLEVDCQECDDNELMSSRYLPGDNPCEVAAENECAKQSIQPSVVKNVDRRKRTEESLSPSRLRVRHKCRQCPRVFPFVSQLNEHEKTHDDIANGNGTDDDDSSVSKVQTDLSESDKDVGISSDDDSVDMRPKHSEGMGTNNWDAIKKQKRKRKNIRFPSDFARSTHTTLENCNFKCDKDGCVKQFPFRATLMAHIVARHKPKDSDSTVGINNFRCNLCDFITSMQTSLISHFFTHTNEEGYRCKVNNCGYTAFRLVDLAQHNNPGGRCSARASDPVNVRYERIRGEETLFKCLKCTKSFAFKAQLMSHEIMDHLEQETPPSTYKCNESSCEFASTFPYEFTDHVFRRHTRENRFKCLWDECDFASVGQVDIRKHVVAHYKELKADNPLKCKCEVCDKTMKSRQYYWKHVREVHILPVECHVCGKLNYRNEDNIVHLRNSHEINGATTDEAKKFRIASTGSFSCGVVGCAEVFPFQASLLAHFVVDHSPGRINRSGSWTCHLCKTEVIGLSLLEQHFFERHTKEKLFKCPSCEFLSTYFETLQEHMKNGDTRPSSKPLPDQWKRFQCTTCEKWFHNKASCVKHMASHSKDRVLSCDLCSSTFKIRGALRLHYFRVHKRRMPRAKPNAITDDLDGTIEKIPPKNSFPCKEKDCGKV